MSKNRLGMLFIKHQHAQPKMHRLAKLKIRVAQKDVGNKNIGFS